MIPFYIETGNYNDPSNPYPVTDLQDKHRLLSGTKQPIYRITPSIRTPTPMPTPWQWECHPLGLAGTTAFRHLGNGYERFSGPIISDHHAAIAAASDDGTIRVYPGVYMENPLVNKRLSIIGSGSGDDPLVDTILRKSSNSAVLAVAASDFPQTPRSDYRICH